MNRSALPPLAFAACGLVWGTTFLAIRVGDESLPPLWACSLRLIAASAVMLVIQLVSRQSWPKGAAFIAAFWYGFFEFGVGLPLLYWGEKVVSSGLAAVLYAICPIAAMLTTRAMGMEQLNPKKLAAGVLAFVGVGVIFWREVLDGGSPAGFAAIVLAAFVAAVAGVMLQRGPKQSPIGANTVGALVGIPTSIIASFVTGEVHKIPVTIREVFPVIYLAIMSSVVAFGLFAWLMNHWKVTTIAFLGVIVPLIAVVVGSAVNHETFGPGVAVGAAIVLVGVVAALRSESSARRPAEEPLSA